MFLVYKTSAYFLVVSFDMVQRRRRDCPIPGCLKKQFVKLSNHLANVHGLNSDARKPWLQRVKDKNNYLSDDRLVFNRPPTVMDPSFKHPTNIQVAGPTFSGKSFWTEKLLRNVNEMFDTKIERIIYCYGEYQPRFLDMEREIPNIQFIEGFPEDIYSLFNQKPGILVLDDLMSESTNKDAMANVITKGCHHRNISTIFLVQNLFPPGKHSRTISLNTHYIVTFKHPRDSLGVSILARQAFPNAVKYVMESYDDAVRKPYGYLLFDLHPSSEQEIRLRTSIFPDENHVVYLKRI